MKQSIDICKNGTTAVVKKIINRNFLELLIDADPGDYCIDNTKSMEMLYYELISKIIDDPMSPFTNKNVVMSIFVEAGIDKIDSFINAIKANINNMKKAFQQVFGEYKSVMAKKLEYMHKWEKKHNVKIMSTVAANAEFSGIPEEERSHYYVVRSHYGEYPIQFYYIGIDLKWSQELSQLLRTKYYEDTNCDYFEGRPIMAINWQKLDDKHKMMTYDGDE